MAPDPSHAVVAAGEVVGRRADDLLGGARGAAQRRPVGSGRSREVRVRLSRGLGPTLVVAPEGDRIRVVFSLGARERDTTVVFPTLGRLTTISAEHDATLELGPLPPGEYEFVAQDLGRQGTLRVA